MFEYALLVYLGYICQTVLMVLYIRPIWCGAFDNDFPSRDTQVSERLE